MYLFVYHNKNDNIYKSEAQEINIDKYKVAENISYKEYHIVSKLIFLQTSFTKFIMIRQLIFNSKNICKIVKN